MHRSAVATTEVTTAHKISVGLLVATATVVVLSTVVAAIYTIASRSTSSVGIPLTTLGSAGESATPVDSSTDRSFTTP